jgi:hypothetical protein
MLEHHRENDAFIQGFIKEKLVPFETKKSFYRRAIHLCDLGKQQQADALVSRNSRWDVTREYIDDLNQICLGLISDFLNNPDEAVCLRYDPIGSERLASAKELRRVSRQMNGRTPTERIFEVPEEIARLAKAPLTALAPAR